MIVTHLAITPLAGSPLRIVHALRTHANVDARLIVLNPAAYGNRTFDTDLVWDPKDPALHDRLARSDILHFHHWLDFNKNPFGIDFQQYLRSGAVAIRQFHTHPLTIAQGSRSLAERIVCDSTPQLVIAQFHERFYPRARVVPNIVPIDDPLYVPIPRDREDVTVFFAPSCATSAWTSRWDTKAAPETTVILRQLQRRLPRMRVNIIQDTPHRECLRLRQQANISIDELATGSYHLSSLESLSQGIPTLAFLDQRMLATLATITGSMDIPWINVTLEMAKTALRQLVSDDQLRAAAGAKSRKWVELNWNDRVVVNHYTNAYRDVLINPQSFFEQRFDPSCPTVRWFVLDRDDLAWETRKEHASRSCFWGLFTRRSIERLADAVDWICRQISALWFRLPTSRHEP